MHPILSNQLSYLLTHGNTPRPVGCLNSDGPPEQAGSPNEFSNLKDLMTEKGERMN